MKLIPSSIFKSQWQEDENGKIIKWEENKFKYKIGDEVIVL